MTAKSVIITNHIEAYNVNGRIPDCLTSGTVDH